MRSWDPTEDEDSDDPSDLNPPDDLEERPRRTVFWRARDSLFFEPLVALAVVALLLVSLYAYTDNWPPVYAVESNSMQHGSGDHLGYLNAGDVVLAQKASVGTIVPYVAAVGRGYTTYGESGDVLLYYPYGQTSVTPVIHRAILYLDWDSSNHWYNATDLSGLPCSDTSASTSYMTPGTSGNCTVTRLVVGDSIHLYHVGQMATIVIDIAGAGLGQHSGYITLGDNNSYIDQSPSANGTGARLSTLVESGWIIGVARGMIPWLGAIKLAFEGEGGFVPPQSWEYLGLTIAGVIFLAVGVHLALRREGIESRLRKREEEEARASRAEDEEEPPVRHRFMAALRPWSADEDEDPSPEERRATHRKASYEEKRRTHFVTHRERPRPHARRPGKKGSDDDEDDR